MQDKVPPRPTNSFRITLDLNRAEKRLDNVLLQAIREQKEDLNLKIVTRTEFKDLFKNGNILIKGQKAKPSSAVAKGITYVDIIGYKN